jgi:CO dehydrogenase nickel-insertion accessory protein CooC1
MPILPFPIIDVLSKFTPLFSRRVFQHVQVLVIGAILTPGQRTVTNALRVIGLQQHRHFQNYHRVLNRAQWSSQKAAHIVLQLLIHTFVPRGVVVLGIDETLERRQGNKIAGLPSG